MSIQTVINITLPQFISFDDYHEIEPAVYNIS